VLLVACVLSAGCDGADVPAGDTLADSAVQPADTGQGPSCLPIVPEVRGSLVGQRESAQREARRVRVAGDSTIRIDQATVTISPACGSHEFRAEDLARGQFVARIAINGMEPRFSRFENDTVYWWVFLNLESGRPVFESEFLSTKATSDTGRSYLRRRDFVIRCKPAAERPRREVAGWEPEADLQACPRTDAQAQFIGRAAVPMAAMQAGTTPWYGCTLGCCQSNRALADEG
jgi:hypothetical protein